MDDNTPTTMTTAYGGAGDRAAKAWRLRVAGGSWDDVAKATGFSDKSNAYRAVRNYFGTVPDVDREILRGVARARGEHLWLRAFQEVERTNGSPAAIRAALEVLRRHAALDGLDAPVEHVVHNPDAGEFAMVIEAAARGLGYSVPEEGDPFEDIEDADVVEDDSDS